MPETYTAYFTDPLSGQTGTTEVPVGQAPPPGYTTEPTSPTTPSETVEGKPTPTITPPKLTPDPSTPDYSLLTDPNYHPELAEDLTGQVIPVATPEGEVQIPVAQWVGMTNAEKYALQHGLPQYDVAFKGDMGLEKLDTGESITKGIYYPHRH